MKSGGGEKNQKKPWKIFDQFGEFWNLHMYNKFSIFSFTSEMRIIYIVQMDFVVIFLLEETYS